MISIEMIAEARSNRVDREAFNLYVTRQSATRYELNVQKFPSGDPICTSSAE